MERCEGDEYSGENRNGYTCRLTLLYVFLINHYIEYRNKYCVLKALVILESNWQLTSRQRQMRRGYIRPKKKVLFIFIFFLMARRHYLLLKIHLNYLYEVDLLACHYLF